MNQPQLRDVLERLARGEITPEQADRDLAGLGGPAEDAPSAHPEPDRPEPEPSVGAPERGTAAIRVRATMNGSGPLSVIGEGITGPEVRGPASADITGGDTEVVVFSNYGDGTELAVPADADLRLEVNGSEVEVRGLTGPLDGIFNVGDAIVGTRLTRGESRIRANAGQVVITLAAGSDVRVLLRAGCSWNVDPGFTEVRPGEWIVGEGRATLIIEGNLGHLDLIGPVDG